MLNKKSSNSNSLKCVYVQIHNTYNFPLPGQPSPPALLWLYDLHISDGILLRELQAGLSPPSSVYTCIHTPTEHPYVHPQCTKSQYIGLKTTNNH